ncbi:histone kinase [Babesia ovis]|uniref:Histone kinase n=1 Tax=Babesia ovis TaxID=5869 RepID=A0A9W5WUR1_BABOV|nr:histone kinase [Babesia ovis]
MGGPTSDPDGEGESTNYIEALLPPAVDHGSDGINMIKDYALLGTLGVGSFGKVRLGIHCETGQKVAVKIIHKDNGMQQGALSRLGREIRAMSGLRHPNVVYVHELIDTPTTLFIVMEYVEGHELFDYISQHVRISEEQVIQLMRQLLAAVDFCHSKMICHRDIKPENIMLDKNMNLKLGDFGLSNFMREGECLRTPCGSPNYASPEVICGKSYSGPEIDIWSCGIVFYVLLCECLPFDDDEMSMLFMAIKQGKFHLPSHLSPDARWLLKRMLDVNPASRITMRELLSHPWFIGCNYDVKDANTEAYIKGFSDRELVFPGVLGTADGGFGVLRMETPNDGDMELAGIVALRCNTFKPRWTMGVPGFTSEMQCIQLVTETLKELGYQWILAPALKIYCRKAGSSEAEPPTFSMQIYKMKYRCHVLDIHLGPVALMPALHEGIRLLQRLKRNLVMASL